MKLVLVALKHLPVQLPARCCPGNQRLPVQHRFTHTLRERGVEEEGGRDVEKGGSEGGGKEGGRKQEKGNREGRRV